MHDWLVHFDSTVWSVRASSVRDTAGGDAGGAGGVEVCTALVYDLNVDDIVLLDRFHQSVAFDDIVIGVQSRAAAAVIDYSCNGKSMQFDPRDAVRSVIASLLQTVWDVAPNYLYIDSNSAHPAAVTDFMWAIGDTPVGYFSRSKRLSFSQRDAAARHVLFHESNSTLSQLSHLLRHFQSFGKEIEQDLQPASHLSISRLSNLLAFKLTQARHFMPLNNFNQSLFYARSAKHDLAAIHSLVHWAMERLAPVIVCNAELCTTWHTQLLHALQIVLLLLLIVAVFRVTAQRKPVPRFLATLLAHCDVCRSKRKKRF
jgi:hypothetical protein